MRALQRSAGNRTVGRLLAQAAASRRLARRPALAGRSLAPTPGATWHGGWDHVPTIGEARQRLTIDNPWLIPWLELSDVVVQDDGVEAFVHPQEGEVVRLRRGRFEFASAQPGESPDRSYGFEVLFVKDLFTSFDITLPPEYLQAAGVDLLVAEYERHFPGHLKGERPARLDNYRRVHLAIELADTSLAGEVEKTLREAIKDPVFVTSTLLMLWIYVGLWLVPDPSGTTKVLAGTLTALLLTIFAWQDLREFALATKWLWDRAAEAEVADELEYIGTRWLERLGPGGLDVLLMILFFGMERSIGARVKAGVRARARTRAQARVTELRDIVSADYRFDPEPGFEGVVSRSRAAAGEQPNATAVLEELAAVLPDDAWWGLETWRTQAGDVGTLKALEGVETAGHNVIEFLRLKARAPEINAAAAALEDAEVAALRARLNELRDDPALRRYKRSLAPELIAKLVAALGGSEPLRAAIEKGDPRDVAGLIGEVLARAELKATFEGLSGYEVRSDLEVARRARDPKTGEQFKTIAEWWSAELDEWQRQGLPPDAQPNKYVARQRADGVWISLGQADNVVVEVLPDGRGEIFWIEESKTGTSDTRAKAETQAREFVDAVASIAEGAPDVGLFERLSQTELGADVTADYDLTDIRRATIRSRGLPGKDFPETMGFDRDTLMKAAEQLMKTGLPWEIRFNTPLPGDEQRQR